MSERFSVGDHVTWNSEAGHVTGTIIKVYLLAHRDRVVSKTELLDAVWGVTMLTNGRITTDNIAPHTDTLDDFPYLGPPHPA